MDKINSAILSVAPGFWTSEHVLVVMNVVLAAATLVVAWVGVKSIQSSNRMAGSSKDLAESTGKLADETANVVQQATEQVTHTKTLADETAKSVRAAAEQVKLGRESLDQERAALQASIRPVVVDVPLGLLFAPSQPNRERKLDKGAIEWSNTDESLIVKVPFRNIGAGPAFVHQALLTTGPGNVYEALTNYRVIPTGEVALIVVSVAANHPDYPVIKTAYIAGHIAAALKYSDLADGQRSQTVLDMDREPDGQRFLVSKVELFECDENWIRATLPYQSTGPA